MKRACYATAAYTVIAVVMTWPLAGGLARDVAWDLGDSVLNMWILSWDCEQFRGIFFGHYAHLRHFFDGNIFHPAPLTLAYSEHLVPQALQILPVYALTRNPILCYNLLFLSTFVLSGLGMFLFARALTGSTAAALVGGLLFAFAPYRVPQSSHLQVLSSQWMPFALYGFRRWIDTGRTRALVGATASVVLQALSCGYYLLYFTPFAAAYVTWELWRVRGTGPATLSASGWRRPARPWLALSVAAAAASIVILPFVVPYLIVSRDLQLARSLPEATRLSADVYSYATASTAQRFWGSRLSDVFRKPEGELFPGAVPVLLALIGVAFGAGVHPPKPEGRRRDARRWGDLFYVVAWGHFIAALAVMLFRRFTLDLWLFDLRVGNATLLLLRGAIAYAVALWLSPHRRARAAAFMTSRGFFAAALAAAIWLSLGPSPQALGRPFELASPYRFLWDHAPGFEGLRVPARFAMIVVLMLATLGAFGAAAIAARRHGTWALGVLALVFLFEAGASPFVVNAVSPVRGFNTPPPQLFPPRRAPAVYQAVGHLPATAVLADLPLGQTDYDVRAMFYSIDRWRPIVNGYSGFFPPHYGRVIVSLSEIPRHADVSTAALRELGVTHVIVHEAAYVDEEGRTTTTTLRMLGATEVFRDGSDVLLALR